MDFSKTSRKKVQTPKKKAAFTPLRKVLDIKPKVESESPIRQTDQNQLAANGKQTINSSARTAGEPEDVKPDVDGLQDLLGGLAIDR